MTEPSDMEGTAAPALPEINLRGQGQASQFVSPSEIAEAIRRGWKINPKRKKDYFAALDRAIKDDLPKIRDRAKRAAAAASCARVLVAEQAAALRDVHHIEAMQHESGILDLRMRRAEEGKPNDCLAVQVTPIERLPEPDWMIEKRRKLLAPGGN